MERRFLSLLAAFPHGGYYAQCSVQSTKALVSGKELFWLGFTSGGQASWLHVMEAECTLLISGGFPGAPNPDVTVFKV